MSDTTPKITITPQYGPVAGHPGYTFTCSECPRAGKWGSTEAFARGAAATHLATTHQSRTRR